MNETRRTVSILAALFLIILIMVSSASALTILQTHSFTITSNPTGEEFLAVRPFDAALGHLDVVAVTINGVLVVQALAPPNLSPPPGPIPIPYPVSARVEQTFFGLGGRFFSFETPGQFLFSGNATGVGESLAFERSFSYTFKFNDRSDLIGTVVPGIVGVDIPPLISGQRVDFLDTSVPLNEIDLLQQTFSFSGGPALQGLQAITDGVMIIQYDYTPVPLPGAVWLLGSGLVGLWRLKRKFMA